MDTKNQVSASAQIRRLNDQFRCFGSGRGSILLTAGVQDQGPDFVARTLNAVRSFNQFTSDNDPLGEHDFGAFSLDGERLFFKMDYYDLALEGHSPDATDAAVTYRVLTIMFASEY